MSREKENNFRISRIGLADRIREARGIASRTSLAKAVGISEGTLRRWEQSKFPTNDSKFIESLLLIADVTRADERWLIEGVEPSEPELVYDTGRVYDIFPGLKDLLSDEDEMLLLDMKEDEIDWLKSIRLSPSGPPPDKGWFKTQLLYYRKWDRDQEEKSDNQ